MEFILVKIFRNYIEANIVKGMLEANNIFCWLKDETQGTIGLYSNGIKLMVREDQVQRALDLMNTTENQT